MRKHAKCRRCSGELSAQIPETLTSSHFCSPSKVARITKLPLTCEITAAETFPGLWPVFATATNKLLLHPLASLGAPLQDAVGAHVGFAHDYVEHLLALTFLERDGADGHDSENFGSLHCNVETRRGQTTRNVF